MKIKIIYFSFLRERLGRSEELMDTKEGAKISNIFQDLFGGQPDLLQWRQHLRAAVNEEYVAFDHILKEGDELVFIPPVAGG